MLEDSIGVPPVPDNDIEMVKHAAAQSPEPTAEYTALPFFEEPMEDEPAPEIILLPDVQDVAPMEERIDELPPPPEPIPVTAPAEDFSLEHLNHVGMYLTPSSVSREKFLTDTMEETGSSGGDAIIFDVKGSVVYFDADTPFAKELGLVKPTYDLEEVVRKAHERGIYVIGRFIAVKDAGITRVRKDTLIRHPKTGNPVGYEFIDPENETALRYNREIICALAKSGIDEVNLDYIRFSTDQFGTLLAYSTEEKSRKVGVFVQMAREAIDECGPATKLGISTYAILGWDYDKNVRTLGQDVKAFAPYVDVISPMAYPATFTTAAYYTPGKDPGSRMYYLVLRTLTGYQNFLGPEHAFKLRPWIQGYGTTTKNMVDQMKAVSDAGLCGFTVWNADNYYNPTYKALPTFDRPEGCVI